MKTTGPKLYHMGGKIRNDGAVSALCFSTQRPIDLAVSLWTIREDAVTCPRCRKLLAERELTKP